MENLYSIIELLIKSCHSYHHDERFKWNILKCTKEYGIPFIGKIECMGPCVYPLKYVRAQYVQFLPTYNDSHQICEILYI